MERILELDQKRNTSLVEDYDKEQKNLVENLKAAIEDFIEKKPQLSPLEKWELFDTMAERFNMLGRDDLISRINRRIKAKGLSLK